MRVPALPDRRRAALHLIEPARHLLLEEDRGGQLGLADLDQRRQQRRRADEAGADAAVGALDRSALK